MINVTRLTLSHNKIQGKNVADQTLSNSYSILIHHVVLGTAVPPGLANLVNLEILNLFNNHITELPISLSQMPKLRILNAGLVYILQSAPCLKICVAAKTY